MKNNLALILILLDIVILIFWVFDIMIIDIFVICFPSTRNNIRLTSSDVIIEWKDMNWENSWYICKIIFPKLNILLCCCSICTDYFFAYFLEPKMVSTYINHYFVLLFIPMIAHEIEYYIYVYLLLFFTFLLFLSLGILIVFLLNCMNS